MAGTLALFAAVVIVYVSFSASAGRVYLSAPMIFMLVGFAFGSHSFYTVDAATMKIVAEVTLALLLFHGAAELKPHDLRRESIITGRLLLIALPLTMAACSFLVLLLFPGSDIWLALLLGAALAPTDSALIPAAVNNPVVPARVRRILALESGLNDGIATPIVLFAISAVVGTSSGTGDRGLWPAMLAILTGVIFGAASGLGAGWLLRIARDRNWAHDELVPLAVLVVPLLSYYGASAVDGNGFMAAFVAGTVFATTQPPRADLGTDLGTDLRLTGLTSALLGCAAWMLFGTATATYMSSLIRWQTVLLALLTLTVVRVVPVVVSLAGSGLRGQTSMFLGWCGPRGLPSVVFALIANDGLAGQPEASTVVSAIAVTVILSVLAHGISAPPLAKRYGAWVRANRPTAEGA